MSQENVEIVQGLYAAINREDLDEVVKHLAPDFELDWSRSIGPRRGVYGFDRARPFLEGFFTSWESFRIVPEDVIDAGEQVVVSETVHHRGRDGIEVTARASVVLTVRDGLLVRASLHQDLAGALEAVGERE
jgi:ketosteroid isomerase-like protein